MKRGFVLLLFFLAGFLFLIAGWLPSLRGRPMNVTFFALGVFWMILGLAMGRKARRREGAEGEGS